MASKSRDGNEVSSRKRQLRSGKASTVDCAAMEMQTCNRVKPTLKNSVPTAGKSRLGKRTRKEKTDADVQPPPKRVQSAERSKNADESSSSQHTTKRTRKALNKKECQGLCTFLNNVDISVLFDTARVKLSEQLLQ